MSFNTDVKELINYFESHQDKILEDFFTFLRFKSVSTEPEFKEDVRDCHDWLAKYLEQIGLEVESWESKGGHPIVFAEWNGAGPDKPTVLFYNHYDVQPVDPLELWKSPPFEPEIRDGEIYARGAGDNKGQCFYPIAAVEALLKETGRLPLNLKWVIEGEEEAGSASLTKILEEKKEKLKADYVVVIDLGYNGPEHPAVTVGVRGISCIDLKITGSNSDLHSGIHGGLVYNPNHALVEILAKLRDENGKITVPGFYDDVKVFSEEELEELDRSFDKEVYETLFKTKAVGGEKDFSPLMSNWIRPTLEINGVSGGYAGRGFKTVIPEVASAKISCRLVPNQDPKKISDAIMAYIREIAPEGVEVEMNAIEFTGKPHITAIHSKVVDAARESYREVLEKDCKVILCGATIPIAKDLTETADGKLVLIGSLWPDDHEHAPNEHFGVERFKQGFAVIVKLLEKLA